jgi:hypothetical protein
LKSADATPWVKSGPLGLDCSDIIFSRRDVATYFFKTGTANSFPKGSETIVAAQSAVAGPM